MSNGLFTIWASRKFLWPKKYICKGVIWGSAGKNDIHEGWIMLILQNETRVFLETRGRSFRYSPEFFFRTVADMNTEAGQKIM